ncbi:MAG: hypothetical protein SCL54_16025, partial [Bacillota bacterium]|nr:hypothetical protein [Bacillota bacterium]
RTRYWYGGNGGNFLKCLVFSVVVDDEASDWMNMVPGYYAAVPAAIHSFQTLDQPLAQSIDYSRISNECHRHSFKHK